MARLRAFFDRHVYLRIIVHAVLVTILIELLSRKSLIKLLRFMFLSPLAFLCNVLIIFMTMMLSRLFPKRQRFVLSFITLIWILFGVVNCVVLKFRMTPFSAEDFNMITSLGMIAKNYFNVAMIIFVIAGLAALAAGIVVLWIKSPVMNVPHRWKSWLLSMVHIVILSFILSGTITLALHTNELSKDFMNLADAYEKYGFAYCFTNSIFDKGIGRPDRYSQRAMKRVADGIRIGKDAGIQCSAFLTSEGESAAKQRESYQPTSAEHPNIIMIQLESFFDPTHIIGYGYSEDPIPTFRALKEQYASGRLIVPVVGAGTANTEFEVLTGMSTAYFGAGEYPYNTVLQDRTVESVPNVLRGAGYQSTVLHNNTGTFYHRDVVFSQMGFDSFIPAEYMYDLETTPNNWAKDKVLTGVIMDTLENSRKRDFIYAITVQSHGRYPEDEILEDPEITVTCEEETASLNALTYYVNEIHEVDEMIAELTQELKSFKEPTVLIMYGDHLPALGFAPEDLSQQSVYETEYVLWNNFGLDLKGQDLDAECLSTAVLSTFGLASGIIPQFHEVYDGTQIYSRYLELLEYDMLYGEGYIFREFADEIGLNQNELETDEPVVQAYEPTDLSIGYRDITISSWEIRYGHLYVNGENFTLASRIVIDGKPMDTIMVEENMLLLDADIPEKFDSLYVGQFDENLNELGEGTNVLAGSENVLGDVLGTETVESEDM